MKDQGQLIEKIDSSKILEEFPVFKLFPQGIGVNMEKKLPYLIVNRKAEKRERKIIANESSTIWAADDSDACDLIRDITTRLADEFGAFLLLEFWVNEKNFNTFRIMFPEGKAPATIEKLEEGFIRFKRQFPHLKIEKDTEGYRSPEDKEEFFSKQDFKKAGILKIGLEIPNFFSDPKTGNQLPVFFRRFLEDFSDTLKKAIYEFVRVQTNLGLTNYQLLGRKILNKAVWEIDKALADIEQQFEFLLLIAPANTDGAWQEFIKNNYNVNPAFHYRLLPVDPDKLKYQLYQIDIDVVDDPTMAFIFREKRSELDTLITMLNERNSKEFRLSSIRLFKSVDEKLLTVARDVLEYVHPKPSDETGIADALYFADTAKKELDYYRKQDPRFSTEIELRDDIVGLMVSKGRLYIDTSLSVAMSRVMPLIQHEVGTHVLTYYNGSQQPLHLLNSGLAGYDELQEGIAVLSEYLVGGLTATRLRTLAARVTATHDMVEGAEFKDVFHDLVNKYGFTKPTAFDLVTRIYQSGGYTKDIIYLRGLLRLMEYLQNGGDTEILFIGKIADKHVSLMQELKYRQVLKPVALYPRYMSDEECLKRLEKVKAGISLTELIN